MQITLTDEEVEELAELFVSDEEQFMKKSAVIMTNAIFNSDNF